MGAVTIYDTTLRDGTQGEGISLSVDDKIKIALKLDKIGVHFIEGGWPGSNPKDMEFFIRIQEQKLEKSIITAFSSTRKAGISAADDNNMRGLLESGVKVVTLFGKSWDFHVTHALKTTLEENLNMIRDSISFLVAKGLRVFYDAEHYFDAYKANPEYALQTIKAAVEAGANTIILCDTNGGTMPFEVKEIVEKVMASVNVPVGIHAHNDCECAVANSIMAIKAGATQVQGTINGYGERSGNANLISIIPNLVFKMGHEVIPKENVKGLRELSHYVSEIANLAHNPSQPYVGRSAFAHKAGIHVNALLKNPETYEHLPPDLVGNNRRVLVSELSGMSNLLYKAEELNLDVSHTTEKTKKILEEIKELEHRGFQFEGAEASFELLLRKAFNGYEEPFELQNFRIIMEAKEDHQVICDATIKVKVGDQIVHTAADGNGPVNALDNALRKALEDFYPGVSDMKLSDYKVRVLDGSLGTSALVRVLIESREGANSWGTVGVSENIIEASWQALIDSIAYRILMKKKEEAN